MIISALNLVDFKIYHNIDAELQFKISGPASCYHLNNSRARCIQELVNIILRELPNFMVAAQEKKKINLPIKSTTLLKSTLEKTPILLCDTAANR